MSEIQIFRPSAASRWLNCPKYACVAGDRSLDSEGGLAAKLGKVKHEAVEKTVNIIRDKWLTEAVKNGAVLQKVFYVDADGKSGEMSCAPSSIETVCDAPEIRRILRIELALAARRAEYKTFPTWSDVELEVLGKQLTHIQILMSLGGAVITELKMRAGDYCLEKNGVAEPIIVQGTADIVIRFANRIMVWDWKFGGIAVDIENPQTRIYAEAAALRTARADTPKPDRIAVDVTVIQPASTTLNELCQTITYHCLTKNPPLQTIQASDIAKKGQWCRFCPLENECCKQCDLL